MAPQQPISGAPARALIPALAAGGWARELSLDALALLWPTSCVGCGALDRELCLACATEIRDLPCACVGCVHSPSPTAYGPNYFVAGPYDGLARDMLIAFKHAGQYGLAKPLGFRLGTVLRHAYRATCARRDPETPPPVIVTVPSRAKRVRERGYRHVDVLVEKSRRSTHMPLKQVRGLRVLPGRTGQVGLDAAARQLNAERVAVPKRAAELLRGRSVFLVDDIVTSGATVRAASQALERVGADVVAVVALCSVTHGNSR